jgi:alkylation response protein AidB-like acyl-CoA dehydrogenase
MELDLGPEIERFRAEVRSWIAANAPPALASLTDWRVAATLGGFRTRALAEAMADPAYAKWERALADARLICPQWPAEFGGRAWTRYGSRC